LADEDSGASEASLTTLACYAAGLTSDIGDCSHPAENKIAMKCNERVSVVAHPANKPEGAPTLERWEVLTIEDGARELRCSKAHLAKVLNGQVAGVPYLPHLRLGRRKLIRRSTLYQWMAEVERAQSGMLSGLPEVRAV
jgi:hypothetical protein